MNTATIMDMMFNTEMIVKDMKGGKEDMTEKRFKQVIVEDMKKSIKEHPVLKKYLDKGINEYGLTEEEAIDIMIGAWLSGMND